MQLILPLLSPRDPSVRALSIGGRTYQVQIARHRRARRYLLRVKRDGSLRLTVPYGAAIREGLAFVEQQRVWIERERARQDRRSAPWTNGSLVMFRGVHEALRVEHTLAICGMERIRLQSAINIRSQCETHFRSVAMLELPARCLELARTHGLTVKRVSVRNQRSRWGSCSPGGVIALNWRLILMPPSVSDYVILHELMHLRQANHSRRFWREVDGVCPAWRESERWLRKHGHEIL